jgi:Phage integrase, N-terminal SAM-like domain
MTPSNRPTTPGRPGPEAIGSIVKRYRRRDRQYAYGQRIRAYGERHWIPLGTEREGWNDVRVVDRRDEIAALINRGAWRPPNTFELDPRERNPGFHEFASDWFKRYRRTVDESTAEKTQYMLSHHLLPFLRSYRLDERSTTPCWRRIARTSWSETRRSRPRGKPASRFGTARVSGAGRSGRARST